MVCLVALMIGFPAATTRWPDPSSIPAHRRAALLHQDRSCPTTGIGGGSSLIVEGATTATLRLRGGRATLLGGRLQALQWAMRKDPQGYVHEMETQKTAWEVAYKELQRSPSMENKELGELAVFFSNMCSHFPQLLGKFPEELLGLVGGNSTSDMAKETRYKLATALTILCARKGCDTEKLCSTFFPLFTIPDKKLRSYMYASCVGAVKRANAKSVDQGMNRRVQRMLATLLQGSDGPSSRLAIIFFVEMYKRRMWDDDHAVNLIGEACFSRSNKVRGTSIAFLLGNDEARDDDGEDDFGIKADAKSEAKKIKVTKLLTAKKRAKKKLRTALIKQAKEERAEKNGLKKGRMGRPSFSVLDQLHDPQAFAERLLLLMRKWATRLSFEHKLLMMELISRLVSTHKLIVLDFSELLKRYISPDQEEVHKVMAFAAQSLHDLTPPEVAADLVKHIADKFIHDR